MPAFVYKAFELTIESEIELPEFLPLHIETSPDVVIRRETIYHPQRRVPENGREVYLTEDGVILSWSEVGAFFVSGGSTILIDAKPDATDEIIRLPLLGMVFGTLLHQRGLFTLHASAVSIAGEAVGFIGQKGAGKSTMTAALAARGHQLVTDDVLAISIDAEDLVLPEVHPGFPQIKLWPSASTAIGDDPERLARIHPLLEKRALYAHDNFRDGPLPLSRIYSLASGKLVSSPPISKQEAFVELLSHSYAARILGSAGGGSVHFRQCQRLVQQIPIRHLFRPTDLSRLNEVAEFIETDDHQRVDSNHES